MAGDIVERKKRQVPPRTHCCNGHELSGYNRFMGSNGYAQCRTCKNESNLRKSREKSAQLTPHIRKAITRRRNLAHWYHMTTGDYALMLDDQGNKCANPHCNEVYDSDEKFHVDHDHKCCPGYGSCGKCIRGLLCRACNTTLGQMEEDRNRIMGLVEYIDKWKTSSTTCSSGETATMTNIKTTSPLVF